jgi:hypothetical protein
MTDTATASDDDRDVGGAGWLAAEVGSLVSASVAFALWLDGSTAVAVPGGSVSALAVTFLLLSLAAVAAGGKASARGQGLRALGHGTLAVGLVVLAAGSSIALVAVGGFTVTVGTLGVLVAVGGANLVVLDVLR